MKTYQIPTLNEKTPATDQSKIVNALTNVDGVSGAVLRPQSHQVDVTSHSQSTPKRDDIATAVSRVGFPLAQ